jgi:hypothetical protein
MADTANRWERKIETKISLILVNIEQQQKMFTVLHTFLKRFIKRLEFPNEKETATLDLAGCWSFVSNLKVDQRVF